MLSSINFKKIVFSNEENRRSIRIIDYKANACITVRQISVRNGR